ncbi:MAG: peptidoglycan domain protein [Bacteroidia bacterium]|nr:peptidoglycan domain protein [Bacteroidia bacterium]
MAKIEEALYILYKLEFSNENDVLERNATENGWTFMGIYQGAFPRLDLWKTVRQKIQQYGGDMKLVGSMMYNDQQTREMVEMFYKKEFWDKAKLDEVVSQQIANEIFIAGVNMGMKKAVMLAQRLVGVSQDGVVGPKTLKAVNAFDTTIFDEMYDILEKDYYDQIVVNNPSKKIYAKGWRNRAVAV